ncbi:tripartite tricarboxylate transporter permease (plasmid) [Sulfitobacter sp. LCG007]
MPFTLYMDFLSAILFLTAIFTGGGFGGSVPAILMNVPGTTAAIATCFDGYPMARQGKHNEALGLALAASTVGTVVGYALLFVILEPISRLVLKLGAPELFLIAMAGLFLIAALAGKYFWRGVLAGALGLMIGTVGMSSSGIMRGTMGSMWMLDGISTTAAIIGLFARLGDLRATALSPSSWPRVTPSISSSARPARRCCRSRTTLPTRS